MQKSGRDYMQCKTEQPFAKFIIQYQSCRQKMIQTLQCICLFGNATTLIKTDLVRQHPD